MSCLFSFSSPNTIWSSLVRELLLLLPFSHPLLSGNCQVAVHPGGRQEEVFRFRVVARRLIMGGPSQGLPARAGYRNFLRLLEAMGRPEGVTLPAKILKASLYCLLIKPGKPYCGGGLQWKVAVADFWIFVQSSFSKAIGIYLVKKQLINMFDLDVETNHIKFQVK